MATTAAKRAVAVKAPLLEKATCKHAGLRSFTFKDGQTIRLCFNCTTFDAARKTILGVQSRPTWFGSSTRSGLRKKS